MSEHLRVSVAHGRQIISSWDGVGPQNNALGAGVVFEASISGDFVHSGMPFIAMFVCAYLVTLCMVRWATVHGRKHACGCHFQRFINIRLGGGRPREFPNSLR